MLSLVLYYVIDQFYIPTCPSFLPGEYYWIVLILVYGVYEGTLVHLPIFYGIDWYFTKNLLSMYWFYYYYIQESLKNIKY
jgi:hypothetical protein